jgi:hypothetical protein
VAAYVHGLLFDRESQVIWVSIFISFRVIVMLFVSIRVTYDGFSLIPYEC